MEAITEPRQDCLGHRPSKPVVESSNLSSPSNTRPSLNLPYPLWFSLLEPPVNPAFRFIPLSQKQVALVDAADYEWLSQWKWHAAWNVPARNFRAQRKATVNGTSRNVYMHRFILGLEFGDPREADHRNHNTLDNTRANLRIATHAENMANLRKFSTNTSGFKGASWHKRDGKWQAKISLGNKSQFLGCYTTPEQAHAAYCEAAKLHRGEFANLA